MGRNNLKIPVRRDVRFSNSSTPNKNHLKTLKCKSNIIFKVPHRIHIIQHPYGIIRDVTTGGKDGAFVPGADFQGAPNEINCGKNFEFLSENIKERALTMVLPRAFCNLIPPLGKMLIEGSFLPWLVYILLSCSHLISRNKQSVRPTITSRTVLAVFVTTTATTFSTYRAKEKQIQ